MKREKGQKASYLTIVLLVLAGEAVFILPFVLLRIFRPTYLAIFSLDNTDLGSCFFVYGIVALISYFFGGFLADRFEPGKLMGVALLLTALGGVYMTYYPSLIELQILFGYWGFTTIFLFWAPMIKATRLWGGELNQGKAFGFLESGRGLVAASVGLFGVLIFGSFLGKDFEALPISSRRAAFQPVLIFASLFVALVGILVFYFLRTKKNSDEPKVNRTDVFNDYVKCFKNPRVLLLMGVILAAYVGYKTTDFVPQYASEILGADELLSAGIGTTLLYMRPLVGLIIGLLANRRAPEKWILYGFLVVFVGALIFSTGIIQSNAYGLYFVSVFILGIGIYATRTLYFTVLKEGKVPVYLTGTAVGVISVVGYLPDIFMGPLSGYFLDEFTGKMGYQLLFGNLAFFAIIGTVCAYQFKRMTSN